MDFVEKILQDTSLSYTHPFHHLFFESESESSDSASSDSGLDEEIDVLSEFVQVLKKNRHEKQPTVIVRIEPDEYRMVIKEEKSNNEIMAVSRNPERFQDNFRMLPSTFEELLKVVAPKIPKQSISKTSAKKQLLATLMFMGIPKKAPYRKIGAELAIPTSAVIQSVHRVINILASLSKTYITWPTGENARYIMQRFRDISSIPCVIGSLNSALIKYGKGVQFNHKDTSMHMQVVSDDEYKFTYLFAGISGSWSKKDVFDISTLNSSEQFFDGDDSYHVVANNSYPLYRNVMVPFIELNEDSGIESLYNMHISEAVGVVDEAITMLTNRIKALNQLTFSVEENVKTFIEAACVVHNFCLLHNDVIEEKIEQGNNSNSGIKQENVDEEITHDFESEAEEKRLAITEHLATLYGMDVG